MQSVAHSKRREFLCSIILGIVSLSDKLLTPPGGEYLAIQGNVLQIRFHFLLDPRGTSDLFTGGLRNVDLISAAEPGERGNKEVRKDCTVLHTFIEVCCVCYDL